MPKHVFLVLLLAVTATFWVANCEHQTVTTMEFYVAGFPWTVIAGPGKGEWNKTDIGFGSFEVFDNRLTETPDPTSKHLGQSRGFFLVDGLQALNSIDLIMLDFKNDQFNGSVALLGPGDFLTHYREFPIVCGTGHFRFAKGYAIVEIYGNIYTGISHYTLHYKKATSLEDF